MSDQLAVLPRKLLLSPVEDARQQEVRRQMERIQTDGGDKGEVGAALDDEARYNPAWVNEMHRRIDEIESGTAVTLSEEEVFFRLRNRRVARCADSQDPLQSSG